MIRREPKATENQVTRFPPGRTSRSGKGCMRRSADMKLHCQSDRQTAACFTLVHLPGSYQPLPPLTRSPSAPMGSVSLGSQVATAPLRTKFACHLQAGGGKFLCTWPFSPGGSVSRDFQVADAPLQIVFLLPQRDAGVSVAFPRFPRNARLNSILFPSIS